MKSPGKKSAPPAEGDGRLYDEKVRLIRPGRLIAGLSMIGVAIIWLILENAFGPSTRQPAPSPTIIAGPTIPSISVAQSFVGGVADVVVQARVDRVNGRAAPAGSVFLVLAVQVINRSSAPLYVAAADFTLLTAAHRIGSGAVLAGHSAIFGRLGIPPKSSAEGDIAFSIPSTAGTLVVVYLPRIRDAKPLKWSAAVTGGL